MIDLVTKCDVCGALIDAEDLFCGNCGKEAPLPIAPAAPPQSYRLTFHFECVGCGASMSYDASAQTLRCPFCGSERLERRQDCDTLAPEFVVPFRFAQDEASATLRQWLGRGFWRPGDLAQSALITKMSAVYVPYWIFRADTHTHWTSDTSQTPTGARADWYPISGEHRGHYSEVLVGASSVLTSGETQSICPFDLSAGAPPAEVDLQNVVVEPFRVPRKYARPLARQILEELEKQAWRGWSQDTPETCASISDWRTWPAVRFCFRCGSWPIGTAIRSFVS